jgi:dTDP-4-dehydrorhamnose reductase
MATDNQIPAQTPQIWGGIECTINRVRQQFIDQLEYSGHYNRPEDIDLLTGIGIRKLRYPILWEKHQPERDSVIDWSWSEKQLNAIREKGVDVIAGLVHHGSGPVFTHMLDDDFPYLLAEYAAKVAEKFPWIQYYTPVNEPLTTARFSGLYGIWYPHARDSESCFRMLLNEIRGTVLSMQAIRKVNPSAKLVQTEDLGKTYSTPKLKYQAKFENERRWLTFDLLCGKVKKGHLLWKYLMNLGITERELQFFQENTCEPDVFGFNHYVTSEDSWMRRSIFTRPIPMVETTGTAMRMWKPYGWSWMRIPALKFCSRKPGTVTRSLSRLLKFICIATGRNSYVGSAMYGTAAITWLRKV